MKKFYYIFVITISVLLTVVILLKNYKIPKPTKNLKIHYTEGSDICKNKKFYAPFETEYCIFEYVKNKSQNEYKTLEKIRKYCLNTTENEYDRRSCIEDIIHSNF